MSQKYQISREEQEYNEWKHRRSFKHEDTLKGCEEVRTCYRNLVKELGSCDELAFEGLQGAVRALLLQSPERKNYNPKAKISLIKGHLLRIVKLCNEVSILHRYLRHLKFEYGTPNRKEQK
jgi:hypothetical protein